MLRIRNLSNMFQKRTLRVLYGQSQAYPYATTLDPRLRNTDGSFRAPLATDTAANSGLARTVAAFTFQGGLVPGMVMVKAAGEGMVVHNGAASIVAFGLLANFVGGTLDDLQDNNEIGVWRGPDSVYELLYPAFDDTGLAAAYAAQSGATSAAGNPVLLYPQPDGRLGITSTTATPIARLVERVSAAKITIELTI